METLTGMYRMSCGLSPVLNFCVKLKATSFGLLLAVLFDYLLNIFLLAQTAWLRLLWQEAGV
jgi:hypothetical protein